MSSGEDGLIGIPFPEHSSELLSRINDQRRAGLLCDLTLTSRGARYPTHRSVMAAVSLYFRRLFGVDEEGGLGGGGDSAFSVCQLDCVSPDALDALLDFAYTATLTIRASNMRDVLRAAQLLGIQCVENACRDILGEEEEPRGGDEKERRGGDEEKEEGGRRSPRRNPDHHHQGANYDKLGTAAATAAAEGREPPPRERGSRRKTDRAKMRRVASVTGIGDPTTAPPHTTVLDPQTTVLDSTALRQQEGQEEEEAGEGSKPVTAGESSSRGLGGGGRRRRQGEEGRKRKWKSHVPQQCPVCRKVIHDARNLPRHMGTHTERSCTYLNGLGLCLSVGNVEDREDLQTSTTVVAPPRVQTSMRRVASVGVEEEEQDPPCTAPPQTTVLDSTALRVGEGVGRSSMSANGGAAAHVCALLTPPPPHRPPSSPAALLIRPPPPAPLDHLLKHEEEEEEEHEGFRPATVAPPPSGEALPALPVLAEAREGSGGGAAGGDSGGRKRRFPSQMPQQCPVCRKVIHGAGKLPRHMRTHAERSCTYNLSGLGLCLSVGNVSEREDSGTRDSGQTPES